MRGAGGSLGFWPIFYVGYLGLSETLGGPLISWFIAVLCDNILTLDTSVIVILPANESDCSLVNRQQGRVRQRGQRCRVGGMSVHDDLFVLG